MSNKKEFSDAEAKKRLKARSKGEMINIILNLSKRIDAHVSKNEEIHDALNELNSGGAFKEYADYSNLMDLVDKDV